MSLVLSAARGSRDERKSKDPEDVSPCHTASGSFLVNILGRCAHSIRRALRVACPRRSLRMFLAPCIPDRYISLFFSSQWEASSIALRAVSLILLGRSSYSRRARRKIDSRGELFIYIHQSPFAARLGTFVVLGFHRHTLRSGPAKATSDSLRRPDLALLPLSPLAVERLRLLPLLLESEVLRD